MILNYLKDAWSYVHLFGSFFLYMFFMKWIDPIGAIVMVLFLCFLWEMIDEFYKRHRTEGNLDWLFDRRGWSWLDILMGIIGIALGLIWIYLV